MMEEWDDAILSDLSDSAFDLPPLEFEDDDEEEEEEGECSSNDSDSNGVNLDEAIVPSLVKKKIEVLVDIGEYHKKVVTLKNDKDDLIRALFKVISNDPELNQYVGTKVIFKVYSEKFNTWVDHDTSNAVTDGMHLQAVFQKRYSPDRGKLHRRHRRPRKRYHSDSSDDYPYKKKFIKYRKVESYEISRKWRNGRYNTAENRSGSSGYISSHDFVRSECGPELNSVEDNSCGFELSQFTRYSNSVPRRFHSIEDEHHLEEEEETEENNEATSDIEDKVIQNSSESAEKAVFSQGDVYRMSLGLSNKNPISALHELCNRLKWKKPEFQLHRHCAVGAINQFWMKVTVNDETYSPELGERKKQLAKASAAKYCLQKLGVFK